MNETTLTILTDLAKLQPALFEQVSSHLVSLTDPSLDENTNNNNVKNTSNEKNDAMEVEGALDGLIEPILTALAAVLKSQTEGERKVSFPSPSFFFYLLFLTYSCEYFVHFVSSS